MMPRRDFTAFYESLADVLSKLLQKLTVSGYHFANRDPVLQPDSAVESSIALFRDSGFPLPESVQAFHRRFGGINLSGRYDHWSDQEYPDPLWVDPLELAADEFEKEFLKSPDHRQWYENTYGGFYVAFAPDYYHKEGVSGGKPYGIVLPIEDEDPFVAGLPWRMRFSEYLEFAVSKGGFPGLGALK